MPKRDRRVEVLFTASEYSDLKKKADKAGLPAGAFIRMSVANREVREAPKADVAALIREVRRAGAMMEQLIKNMGGRNAPGAEELNRALAENRAAEKMIADAYGS